VVVECETLSLSRGVPAAVRWIVGPYLDSVPRESLESTLLPIREAAGRGGELVPISSSCSMKEGHEMPSNEDWDPKVLGSIASTVESIRDRVTGIESRMDSLEYRVDAGFTAVRGGIEQVHLRLDSIERMLSARLDRIENEVSRLRSVVYLLVKDRPELLRLLGETSVS
jgi:hypothetical protein